MNNTMRAYHVGENGDGEHVIVFATSGAAARRRGGDQLGLDFADVEFCRRASWADQYADAPFIPAQAYLENGWWQECGSCWNMLSQDSEDDDGNPIEIVFSGRDCYCNAGCQSAKQQRIDELNARGEHFKDAATRMRPDLEYSCWRAGWPYITQSANFNFPGGQYGGSVRMDPGSDELSWYIANGDKAAWDECNRQLAQVRDGGEG